MRSLMGGPHHFHSLTFQYFNQLVNKELIKLGQILQTQWHSRYRRRDRHQLHNWLLYRMSWNKRNETKHYFILGPGFPTRALLVGMLLASGTIYRPVHTDLHCNVNSFKKQHSWRLLYLTVPFVITTLRYLLPCPYSFFSILTTKNNKRGPIIITIFCPFTTGT